MVRAWPLPVCRIVWPCLNHTHLNHAAGAGEFSTPRTIKQHFLENVDLTGKPRKSLFARLSAFAGDEATRARLSSDDYAEFCAREKRGLYHILKDNPSLRLGLDSLLSLAPPLLPRYYSIASSPKVSSTTQPPHTTHTAHVAKGLMCDVGHHHHSSRRAGCS